MMPLKRTAIILLAIAAHLTTVDSRNAPGVRRRRNAEDPGKRGGKKHERKGEVTGARKHLFIVDEDERIANDQQTDRFWERILQQSSQVSDNNDDVRGRNPKPEDDADERQRIENRLRQRNASAGKSTKAPGKGKGKGKGGKGKGGKSSKSSK